MLMAEIRFHILISEKNCRVVINLVLIYIGSLCDDFLLLIIN